MADNDCAVLAPERFYKRMLLCFTKPSYLITLCTNNLRSENSVRLCNLLRILVRHRNWADTSGVLSVLLKGTQKDTSPSLIRFKNLVSMELVDRIECSDSNFTAIESFFDTWMTRIGVNLSNKRRRIGALKELWYSGLPEEMQLTDYKLVSTPTHSDMHAVLLQSIMSATRLSYEKDLVGCNSVFSEKSNTYFECESETSVMNDKRIDVADNHFDQEVATVEINNNLPRE